MEGNTPPSEAEKKNKEGWVRRKKVRAGDHGGGSNLKLG